MCLHHSVRLDCVFLLSYDAEDSDLSSQDDNDDDHQGQSRSGSPVRKQLRPTNQVVHKRSALDDLMAAAPPQRLIATSSSSSPPLKKAKRTVVSKSLMQELDKAVTGTGDLVGAASMSTASRDASRRKSSNPQARSTTARSSPSSPQQHEQPDTKPAGSPFRHWLGFGAIEDGSGAGGGIIRKPFSIQSWLLNGFRRKRQSETKTCTD